MSLSALIRYGVYPVVMTSTVGAVGLVLYGVLPTWPALAVIATLGIAAVALLERLQPYERDWLRDHGDLRADVLHAIFHLGLLAGTAYALHALRGVLPVLTLWPTAWPLWVQLLMAGSLIDFALYAMHRYSHHAPWAWRLHAIHHSAERLYWLNGERRHPLSALLMAGPGLLVTVALGAPPHILSAWLTLLSVQLAFQHANVDYRVGPLRRWLGVAEVHRWHHKREYEDAQVNFGEFFMFWDRLFGTFLDRPEPLRAGDVGLREETMPADYRRQLAWPFLHRATHDPRTQALDTHLAGGYAALRSGDQAEAYALLEQAHVLGQPHTWAHVRSHVAFLRWAIRNRDGREIVGQLLRIAAAGLFTWLWMPRGNTGGTTMGAFRSRTIPIELRRYLP